VLCYILSHVHVLRLLPARIALLQCVEDISDKSKIEVLLPVLLALSQDNRSVQPESPAEQFASLVVASFDLSVSSALNDTKGPLWDVFVAIVQHYLQPGMFILKFACYGTHHFKDPQRPLGRFSCRN
jgi:U3 small nucleolar RNA-associated protein 10